MWELKRPTNGSSVGVVHARCSASPSARGSCREHDDRMRGAGQGQGVGGGRAGWTQKWAGTAAKHGALGLLLTFTPLEMSLSLQTRLQSITTPPLPQRSPDPTRNMRQPEQHCRGQLSLMFSDFRRGGGHYKSIFFWFANQPNWNACTNVTYPVILSLKETQKIDSVHKRYVYKSNPWKTS